jgi:hypothetical protein
MRSTVEVLAHHLRCFAERDIDATPSDYPADVPISLAGSQLDPVRHVCALFHSDEEEYRGLLPFIKHGFECGHRAIHVMNLQQQMSTSTDSPRRANTDTYLRVGCFDQDRMRCSKNWPLALRAADFH